MTDRGHTGISRIVLCGAPRSGKKRLLTALAQHAGGPPPTIAKSSGKGASMSSAITVDARKGTGVNALAKAIQDAHHRVSAS